MCDHVTNVMRRACNDSEVRTELIRIIVEHVWRSLIEGPQRTLTFGAHIYLVPGPTGFTSFRVEFFRYDWEKLRSDLRLEHNGYWDPDTLRCEGGIFEVLADAKNQEVHVVFW